MIGIFNRSHYEDILVPRVHGMLPKKVWSARYDQINDFERMLAENGVVILKFMLHISRDEQKRATRGAHRPTETKNWKFRVGDLEDRKRWDDFTKAYRAILEKTSTDWAPWYRRSRRRQGRAQLSHRATHRGHARVVRSQVSAGRSEAGRGECRMKRPPRYALLLAVIACTHTPPAPPAASPQRTFDATPAPLSLERYEPQIRAFETADRASMPAPGGIVFVGSSSIRLWTSLAADFPGLPVLNRGFGGSTFPEANHYVSRAVLRYRPRTVVLYEGDNDITLGRSPQQVLADYREFVRLVRDSLPRARIVFIGIKPSPSRWKLVDLQREANRLVRDVVARDTLLAYVDVFEPMLGANGRPQPALFVGDSLHMTPAGYAIWRTQVAPFVR